MQVAATGGEVIPVSTVLENPRLCNLSPDRSEMLVLAGEGEAPLPLWVMPVAGGSPRRIGGILANDAAWCADPERLVYAAGHDIFVVRKDGTGSQRLVTVEGFPTGLCWSPDGRAASVSRLGSRPGLARAVGSDGEWDGFASPVSRLIRAGLLVFRCLEPGDEHLLFSGSLGGSD